MTRQVPPGMAAQAAARLTTWTRCWIFTRTDGAVFGFTEHDATLTVDGVPCRAETGLDGASYDATLGGAADGADIKGAVSDAAILEADLRAGRWDGATWRELRVNWSDPAEFVTLAAGTLGPITWQGAAFEAQLITIMEAANRPRGRDVAETCDAILGDARCGATLTGTTAEVTATGLGWAEVVGIAAVAGDWFSGGQVRRADGSMLAVCHKHEGSRLWWRGTAPAVAAGETLILFPGCDKTFQTCVARFDNAVNFRGCPHVPGDETMYRNTEGGEGGSRFE